MAGEVPEGFELLPPQAVPPVSASGLVETIPDRPSYDFLMGGQAAPAAAPAPAPASAGGLPPGFELEGSPDVSTSNVIRAATQNTGIPGVATAFNYLAGGAEAAQTGVRRALGLSPLHPEYSQADTFMQRVREDAAREERAGKTFDEAHPIVSTVAGLTGGGALLAPVGATGVGARLLGLTGRNLATRAATAGGTFGALGAGTAYEKGDDPLTGGLAGAAFGAAGPIGGKLVGAAINPLIERGLMGRGGVLNNPAIRSQMETAAEQAVGGKHPYGAPLTEGNRLTSEAYDVANRNNYAKVDRWAALDPRAARDAVSDVERAMQSGGNNFSRTYNKPVFDVLDKLNNPYSLHLRFGEVQQNLQALNAMARQFPPTPNSAAARVAHDALQTWMDNIPQKYMIGGNVPQAIADLKAANKGYKASMDFKKVLTQIEEAQLRNQTGRVEDLPGKLKDTFKPLVRELDKGQWRPAPEVADAVRRTATGSTYLMRSLGKLSPQSGIPMYAEMAGLMTHPFHAIGAAATGLAARRAEQEIVMGRAQRALSAAAAQHPATTAFGALNPAPAAMAGNMFAAGRPVGRALRLAPAATLRYLPREAVDQPAQQ